jgi:hypothetical protein
VFAGYGEKFFIFSKMRKFLLAHLIDFHRKFTRRRRGLPASGGLVRRSLGEGGFFCAHFVED